MLQRSPTSGNRRLFATGTEQRNPTSGRSSVVILLMVLGLILTSGVGNYGVRPADSVSPHSPASVTEAGRSTSSLGTPHAPSKPNGGLADINLSGDQHQTIAASTTVGNITLQDNSSLAVTGTGPSSVVLSVQGNILIEGNATLYVNRSSMEILQSFEQEDHIQTFDGARFWVDKSDVESGGYTWTAHFYGNSNVSIIDSTFCDVGSSWLGNNIAYNATFTAENSSLGSDVTLLDNAATPNFAWVRIVNTSGFNIWPNFGPGATANITLPSPSPANHHLTWMNWTFPGSAAVSGVSYHIVLLDDRVGRIGPHVWDGADVTLNNAVNMQVGFFVWHSTDTFSGFRNQHYASFDFVTSDFSVHLRNVTMYDWSFFPYGAHLTVSESDVGQMISQSGSSASLIDDNYTGLAGYLGAVDTSSAEAENCSIHALVSTQGSAFIEVINSTLYPETLAQSSYVVQANEQSTIDLLDSTNDAGLGFQAQQQGRIDVLHTLSITAYLNGEPAASAGVRAVWSSNGTLAAVATANSSGQVSLPLDELSVTVSGEVWIENYTVTGFEGLNVAVVQVTMSQPISVQLVLEALVHSTSPANQTTLVPVSSAIVIEFGQPMMTVATTSAVTLAPSVSFTSSWNSNDSWLTLQPGTLQPNVTYTVELSKGATTASGVGFPENFYFWFTTAPSATASKLNSVEISPLSITLEVGNSSTFTAYPSCQGGACPGGVSYSWSLNSTLGKLNVSSGSQVLFTAGSKAGAVSLTVHATLDSKTVNGTSNITLSATAVPTLSSVSISPSSPPVTVGTTQDFSASPSCNGGPCPSGTVYGWTLSNALGNLSSTSGPTVTFTAGSSPGTVTLTVVATLNGRTAWANTSIAIQAHSSSSHGFLSYLLIGGIVAVVALAVAIVLIRRRKGAQSAPPPPTASSSPPPAGTPPPA